MGTSLRVFVALRPDPTQVEHLEAFLEPRLDHGRADGLRWSPSEQWHLTLAFAPAAEDYRLDEVGERLEALGLRCDDLEWGLGGGGAFPDPSRATVLTAGIAVSEPGRATLGRLATGARTALATAGVPVDGSRFRPHLTLARRTRPAEVSSWVRLLDAYAGPVAVAGELELVASHLGEGPRGRPRHEVLATYPLGAPQRRWWLA